MFDIEINDKINEVITIIHDEDETDFLYETLITLITNKYQNIDIKKAIEEIAYNSKLYATIDKLLKEINNEVKILKQSIKF